VVEEGTRNSILTVKNLGRTLSEGTAENKGDV
jgi:hypothetical protein